MTTSPVVLAFQAATNIKSTRARKKTSRGDIRIIEARTTWSLRTAFAAALVIALMIPVAESIFITSTTGKFVMRFADAATLLAIAVSLTNAYLLDCRLKKSSQSR